MHQQADAPSGSCAVARTDYCLPSLSAVWCLQLLLLLRSWDTPEETQEREMEEDGVCQEGKYFVPFLSKSLLSHPTVMLLEVSVPSAGDSCAQLSLRLHCLLELTP